MDKRASGWSGRAAKAHSLHRTAPQSGIRPLAGDLSRKSQHQIPGIANIDREEKE
jgi:hypothetical protein